VIERRRRWKFTCEDRDRHGNVRRYVRVPGKPKVRLHAEPGTDAFEEEYRRALDANPPPPKPAVGKVAPGSLDSFIVAYYACGDFRRMDQRSQHVRRLILEKFRTEHGSKPAARLEDRHIRHIRDARIETPEAANSLLKALRAVFKFAMAEKLASDNPALRVPYLAPKNPEGFATWGPDDIAKFEARHPIGSMPRLALTLLLTTAVRRSDAVMLGRQHVSGRELRFTMTKGRKRKPMRMVLPILPALAEALEATPGKGALTFLANQRGEPFSPDTFGNTFRRWCRQAGVTKGLAAHGLRKAVATQIAEDGGSAHEIMAALGHRTLKEADRYSRAAERRVMAGRGLARMSRTAAEQKNVPPTAGTVEWDETAGQPVDAEGEEGWMVPRGGARRTRRGTRLSGASGSSAR
jgi:integrase